MKVSVLYLLFALTVLAFAVLRMVRHRRKARSASSEPAENSDETAENSTGDDCDGACGTCAAECKMEQLLAPPVYFEDEELDAYAHRASDSYTPDEIALFEEVLTTLRLAEVPEWLTSLEQRDVALPDALKDIAYVLVREARAAG